MKKPFQKSFEKRPWLRIAFNRYLWVGLFFVVWMLFLDDYSYLNHRVLNKEIEELETNKSYYIEEIKADEKEIKQLKNPDYIEKYAREKYFMKRPQEDIYIIEFEETQPKDEPSKSL
ncbi:MAG: FtsB family cell division protein [Flavobacterium sp.]